MKPIFLISLPRAGSTLLQRILMSHSQIASKSEPWFMLPLMHMLKPDGMITHYNHQWATVAVQDYIDSLPNGAHDYKKLLREFCLNLYQLNCRNNETYFLDKTPRYYLIIHELAALFPEARFIFLSRNPIHIIASIINTFSGNTLRNLHFYHIDFFQGLDKIASGIESLGERALHVRYEDLVVTPIAATKKIFSFLELETETVNTPPIDDRGLHGKLGDKWGTHEYATIEDKSINKWRDVLNEGTRKAHVRQIIRRMDEKTLMTHGYDKAELLIEIDQLKTRTTLRSVSDIMDIVRSKAIKFAYLNLYRKRIKSWTKDVVIG